MQLVLFKIQQKGQKQLESLWFIGTILMDLSKAYDCLPHDLLMVNYDFDNGSLNLFLVYVSFRKKRTKFGSASSKWSNIRR